MTESVAHPRALLDCKNTNLMPTATRYQNAILTMPSGPATKTVSDAIPITTKNAVLPAIVDGHHHEKPLTCSVDGESESWTTVTHSPLIDLACSVEGEAESGASGSGDDSTESGSTVTPGGAAWPNGVGAMNTYPHELHFTRLPKAGGTSLKVFGQLGHLLDIAMNSVYPSSIEAALVLDLAGSGSNWLQTRVTRAD